MGMDFPLDIARREIKRTYRLLDEDEKRKFEECLTEEQKFYFDVLIRREIEVVYMLDAKSRLLERTVKENKEMQKKQESRIRKRNRLQNWKKIRNKTITISKKRIKNSKN